jgi:hypothetical protein
VDLLAIGGSPNFRPKEPQASLNQPMVQVHENHIVAACRCLGVECDRTLLLGVRVQKPGKGCQEGSENRGT